MKVTIKSHENHQQIPNSKSPQQVAIGHLVAAEKIWHLLCGLGCFHEGMGMMIVSRKRLFIEKAKHIDI